MHPSLLSSLQVIVPEGFLLHSLDYPDLAIAFSLIFFIYVYLSRYVVPRVVDLSLLPSLENLLELKDCYWSASRRTFSLS